MGNGKRGGLLRKRKRKFPNENNDRVHENREGAVLKFASQIAADPRVRTEQRQMTFAPTARNVGEHGQDRQFVIVVPEKERIVPEKEQTKEADDKTGGDCAKEI